MAIILHFHHFKIACFAGVLRYEYGFMIFTGCLKAIYYHLPYLFYIGFCGCFYKCIFYMAINSC